MWQGSWQLQGSMHGVQFSASKGNSAVCGLACSAGLEMVFAMTGVCKPCNTWVGQAGLPVRFQGAVCTPCHWGLQESAAKMSKDKLAVDAHYPVRCRPCLPTIQV
jgi:hypothetical protein